MDKKVFFTAVLKKLGIPYSDNAIAFLMKWASYEGRAKGKPHGFNPLNTTWNNKADQGQTNFNTNAGYPVKNYSTFESGVLATAETLKLRYYKNVFNALKNALPLEMALNTAGIAKELKVWGTHTFAKLFIDGKAAPKTDKGPTSGPGLIVSILLILGIILVIKEYAGN